MACISRGRGKCGSRRQRAGRGICEFNWRYCSIDQFSFSARRGDSFSIASLFEIVVSDSGCAAAFAQLSEALRNTQSLLTLTRAHQRLTQAIKRGGIVRFSGERHAKRRDRFRIFPLLRVNLSGVDICTYVVWINLQDSLKSEQCVVESAL